MKFIEKKYAAELIVVGAGFAGICAAIQAARKGVSVVLINDRGVLGGNSSAEIGVSVNGSNDFSPLNINSREGGICNEIMEEYKYRTPVKRSRYVFDGVLIDFIDREKNIKLFLNTCIDHAVVENGIIKGVSGSQNTTETRWNFVGRWFVDNTGDGTLGALSGAEFMLGRESKDTFGEKIAPDVADKYVIPSTLTFHACDAGYKIPFKAPDFAFDLPATGALEKRTISQDTFYRSEWHYEIGGEYDHVYDREKIIADHKALAFGIWDYIKNSGKYPQADNYDIEYMSCIPGTREYRRLVGDYILTEKDIVERPDHEDTVGHGGWSIDLHALKGFFDEDIINRHIRFEGVYKIPYRTSYSKNIENLFMCGRCMSCSHVAFGSTRVQATLSTVGQAVGMAAYLCRKYDTSPRGIYQKHMRELQQQLLCEGQWLIGVKNEDINDQSKDAVITASSVQKLELTKQNHIDVDNIIRKKAPEFQQRERRRYVGISDKINLNNSLGLSIPVDQSLEGMSILLKAKSKTTLKYSVYTPKVIENYGPDKLIFTNEICINNTEQFEWITLPIHIDVSSTYVFIELKENDAIDAAISGEPLPNTMMFRHEVNEVETTYDYSTLKMAERTWERSPCSICYKTIPEQNVYTSENIINGYNRAYGAPNMWLSAERDKQAFLTMKWQKEISLSALQITFATDTTKELYWEHFEPVFPLLAQDYSVYAKINGHDTLIAQVNDNHAMVNRLTFDEIVTDNIIIKFSKSVTNQIGVYEIRAY